MSMRVCVCVCVVCERSKDQPHSDLFSPSLHTMRHIKQLPLQTHTHTHPQVRSFSSLLLPVTPFLPIFVLPLTRTFNLQRIRIEDLQRRRRSTTAVTMSNETILSIHLPLLLVSLPCIVNIPNRNRHSRRVIKFGKRHVRNKRQRP